MAMLDITFLPKPTVSDKSQCRHPNTEKYYTVTVSFFGPCPSSKIFKTLYITTV